MGAGEQYQADRDTYRQVDEDGYADYLHLLSCVVSHREYWEHRTDVPRLMTSKTRKVSMIPWSGFFPKIDAIAFFILENSDKDGQSIFEEYDTTPSSRGDLSLENFGRLSVSGTSTARGVNFLDSKNGPSGVFSAAGTSSSPASLFWEVCSAPAASGASAGASSRRLRRNFSPSSPEFFFPCPNRTRKRWSRSIFP